MSKRKRNLLIGAAIFFVLFFTVGGHFINKYYNEWVKRQPKMYVYQTYFGPANSVLIIENLKYKDALVKYYDSIEKNPNSNPTFEVPLKTLPQFDPVYVIDYTEDSLLAEVVSYYDRGIRRGGSFTKGWVYAKTLHKTAPSKN